jgi:16S rRNA G966 N2-methylase RsmD
MSGEKMLDEPFENDDLGGLDLPEVERLADERNKKINEAGAYVTGLYWDLGRFLLRLQELCGKKYGEWEKRLLRIGVERTRATKAMKIKETFACRADCEQLPLERAYAMRKRKKTVEYLPQEPPDNSSFSPTEHIHTYNSRFQDLEGLGHVRPETVDLLPCDPPYISEWLPQLPDLAAFAARVLKPNGLVAIYYGKDHLDALFREMGNHLKYLATFCHPYEADGMRSVNHLNIEVCWKPVVVFGKGTWKSPRKIDDMLPAFPAQKTRDYWEQPLTLVEHLLQVFSEEDDLVLDPVAGTFTVMEACFNKNRRCVACDIDPAMMLHARQRWEAIKRRIYDDLHDDAAGGHLTDPVA